MYGNKFIDCYDIAPDAMEKPSKTPSEIINNEAVKLLYIASNHASHTDYAVSAIEAWQITIAYSDHAARDENFSISLRNEDEITFPSIHLIFRPSATDL